MRPRKRTRASRCTGSPHFVRLSFNGLHTPDVEAAKRFYGSVFGWGTLTTDGATDSVTAGRQHLRLLRAASPDELQQGDP